MKKNRNPHKNRKLIGLLLFGVSIIVFISFMGRFSYLMIVKEVNGELLIARADEQYSGSSILSAKRGTIFDSDGEPIAEDSTSYSLYAILDPNHSEGSEVSLHVEDKEKTAEELSHVIELSKEEILSILNQPAKFQVEFGAKGTNLNLSQKNMIDEKKLPGINFHETPTRLYTQGVFASHLIGFAQLKDKSHELEGQMGIEQIFDDVLKGNDGSKTYMKDRFGYILPNSKIEVKEPKDGKDIYLTIDTRIQSYLETTMTSVFEQYQPENLSAIMVRAKTGEIVAMSQRPTFNLETKEGVEEWKNILLQDTFEPGSTMKVFTLAAAIETGNFHPNAIYTSSKMTFDTQDVRDSYAPGWGDITYLEGLQRSSNIAFINLMNQMGSDTWRDYMNRFGFGKNTNSGLPGEVDGQIPFTYPIEKATSAFGQGTTVTVFQMMQGFTAIANGGKMLKLQYVKKIVDPNTGEEEVMKPTVIGQPVSETTTQQELQYLKTVVEAEAGTAKQFAIEGESIAAKTGTAEIVGPDGQYMTGYRDYIFSVVGFAPAEDPEYILYLTIKRPEKMAEDQYGSDILKEIFNPVMELALQYSKVDANETEATKAIEMPKVTGEEKVNVLEQMQGLGLNATIIGNGEKIVQQLPMQGEDILPHQKIVLLTDKDMIMPNVTGWSKKDVLKISEITGIQFKFEGDGYVVEQSLAENQVLDGNSDVTIRLEKR